MPRSGGFSIYIQTHPSSYAQVGFVIWGVGGLLHPEDMSYGHA